jgi:hypothetical protein
MALGSIQLLIEMSTGYLAGVKALPARKADLTDICEPTVFNKLEPRRLPTPWASAACTGIPLPIYLLRS